MAYEHNNLGDEIADDDADKKNTGKDESLNKEVNDYENDDLDNEKNHSNKKQLTRVFKVSNEGKTQETWIFNGFTEKEKAQAPLEAPNKILEEDNDYETLYEDFEDESLNDKIIDYEDEDLKDGKNHSNKKQLNWIFKVSNEREAQAGLEAANKILEEDNDYESLYEDSEDQNLDQDDDYESLYEDSEDEDSEDEILSLNEILALNKKTIDYENENLKDEKNHSTNKQLNWIFNGFTEKEKAQAGLEFANIFGEDAEDESFYEDAEDETLGENNEDENLDDDIDYESLNEEPTDYEDDDLDDEKNDNTNKRINWIFNGSNEEDNNSSKPIDYKKFTRDLTKEAYQGKLDPVIGREKEIKRLIQILSRRTKNNPVIVGEPGVGKTAVVEGLAQRIASYDVPDNLISSKIITLDIGALIAGTRYRGEFEERLRFIIDKVQKSPKRILFIDEIHTLIGAGSAEGTMDAANMLKPVLARGNFRCIGATTIKEYKRYIERDPALERRFQPIVVDPPSVVDTVVILAGLRRSYEGFHDVLITNEALLAAAKYSDQYVPDRFLPDKAIDVIDEACAQVKLEAVNTSDSIKEYTIELNRLLLEKDKLIRQQNYYMAAKIYEKEKQIRNLIKSCSKSLEKNKKLT